VSNAYQTSTINVITYWDKSGHLIAGRAFDLETQQLSLTLKALSAISMRVVMWSNARM